MFLNYLIFTLMTSCFAGNVLTETSAPQNLPGNLGNVSAASSYGSNHGSAAATQKPVAETSNQPTGINTTTEVTRITTEENKNTSQPYNNTATNVTADRNNKTAHNNTVKDKVTNITVSDTSTLKDTNKTETKNTIDNRTNNKGNKTASDNAVDHYNVTNSTKKIVNNTAVSQSNLTTQKPDLIHANSNNNDTNNAKIKPGGPSQTTNYNSSTNDENTTLPLTTKIKANGTGTDIQANGSTIHSNNSTKKENITAASSTTTISTDIQANGSTIHSNNSTKKENITAASSTTTISTDIQTNGSTKHSNNSTKKENITAASITTTISTGVRKWQAVLITALVVAAGCCAVVLVKKSLRSERGRAWLERTRRRAHVPGRDYEVEYLVIRGSDD